MPTYEWLELLASRHPADLDALAPDPTDVPALVRPNPTLQVGVYHRHVHRLGPACPEVPHLEAPTVYFVWRRPRTDALAFHRVGLLIARAIAMAALEPASEAALVARLARDAPELPLETIATELAQAVAALREREGVLSP